MKSANLWTLTLILTLVGAGAVAAQPQPHLTLDDTFARVAEEIPGFGGMYHDAQGKAHVFVTNPAAARTVLHLGEDVEIHQGQFEFGQLQDWRVNLRSTTFNLPGVNTLDVDETRNRIVVGIAPSATPAQRQAIRTSIGFQRVPEEAVLFEEQRPIFPMVHTLRDEFRPVPGGVQIQFSGLICTLGFNASRSGVMGFVTNSHCTDSQGGVESTEYFQPLSPEFIGTEIADPEYSHCSRSRLCRFSDAAFVAYETPTLNGGDQIARTLFRASSFGAVEVDHSQPFLFVVGTASVGVGAEVNKIGPTTGWTFGNVTDSCVDVNVSGSRFQLLCQDLVAGGVGAGDSGSPVFTWDGGDNATLVGILWGGNSTGDLFVFSPYSAIQSELGLD